MQQAVVFNKEESKKKKEDKTWIVSIVAINLKLEIPKGAIKTRQ